MRTAGYRGYPVREVVIGGVRGRLAVAEVAGRWRLDCPFRANHTYFCTVGVQRIYAARFGRFRDSEMKDRKGEVEKVGGFRSNGALRVTD